jgi:Na+-driven multidrug efflux pump
MDRVKDGLRHGMMMCAAFTLVMMIAMQLFGNQIIGIFVGEEEVIRIGSTALRITSWFYIFLALIYMCRGVLNGVGDALFSFINGVVEVACRIFLPMLLIMIPTMGMWAIWWTTGATWLISGLTCLLRYVYWRHKAIRTAGTGEAAQPA